MRSDLELLDAWRDGDTVAGDTLVSRHWASIAGFFRAKIGDDGADLISQTFLACVEGRDRITGNNIKAYLFAVARRRLADHFRTRARSPIVAIDLDASSLAELTGLAHLAPGPATALDQHQRADLLRLGLARIPLDDQIALELTYFEGLSGREVAEVLAVHENTIRSRLARARDKLRAALATLATPEAAALADSALAP